MENTQSKTDDSKLNNFFLKTVENYVTNKRFVSVVAALGLVYGLESIKKIKNISISMFSGYQGVFR